MCRLLCYMGVPVPMEVLVTKPEHSLVLQSRNACFHPGCPDKRNIRVNGDGFGIAWYTPKRISEGGCVVKFPTPAWSSTNLLNIAKFVESGLVFAHVRAASDGAVLVGSVNHENTHPFKHKRYTFMHNGGIPGFDGMKRHLLAQLGDAAYKAIEGTTDSEVCFAFFLDELPNTDDQLTAAEIAQVLRQTIARIVVAVARFATPPRTPAPGTARAAAAPVTTATPTSASPCRNNGAGATHPARAADTDDAPDAADGSPAAQNGGSNSTASVGGEAAAAAVAAAAAAAPAMSLNFCVTDGRHIVCSRYRNHPWHDPPSLFVLSGAGFACEREGSCLRLTAAEPQTSVVISSEPLCRSTKSWELVPRNSMVVVEGVVPTLAAAAAAAASDDGIGTTGERAQAVGSRGGDDDTSKPTSTTPGFGSAGAAAGGRAAAAAEEPSGVGLVSSIRYEPLRCHPSDIPAPNDPSFPDPALLPTSCARVHDGGGNGRGKTSGGCLASTAGGGVKFGVAAGGREVFGNGVHGGVSFGGDETGDASGTQLREYEEAVSSAAAAAAAVTATATTVAAAASTASSSALRQGASAATLQQ